MPEQRTYKIHHTEGEAYFGPKRPETEQPLELTTQQLSAIIKDLPLPLKVDNPQIVAWGAHSAAIRVASEDGTNYIAVIRYTEQSNSFEPEIQSKLLSDEIQSVFEGSAVPRWHIFSADAQGHPLTIRVSKEVQGATLDDIGTLHMLGNPKALQGYIKLCTEISDLLKHDRTFDISGHGGIKKFLPFLSKNILLDLGSDLSAVDIEILGEHDFSEGMSLKDKGKIFLMSSSVVLSGLVAKGVNYLLENTRYNTTEKQRDNSPEFIDPVKSLEEIINKVESLGIGYRVVGGFAFAGYLQKSGIEYQLSAARRDGTNRDVDLFLFSPRTEAISQLENEINQLAQADRSQLPISIQCLQEERAFTSRTITHINDSGAISLRYDAMETNIHSDDFAEVEVQYEGVNIKTLPLGTLVGLTLTRQGAIPFDDLMKITQCFETYKELRVPSEFLDFAKRIRSEHKKRYTKWQVKEWVNLLTGNGYDRLRQKSS